MVFSLKDSFEKHCKNYSSRVLNTEKYANLALEDRMVVQFLKKNWADKDSCVLIDAGCGTGDRLRTLFANRGLPKEWFTTIVGIDYAKGMLDRAKGQRIRGMPLYNELRLVDLLRIPDFPQGDLVLCLWGIVNGSCLEVRKLLPNLGKMVRESGFLIYDVTTTRALQFLKRQEEEVLASHSELDPHDDNQTVWYERDDGTVGYLRLVSPKELNHLAKSTGIELSEVWGYVHSDLKPHLLNLENGCIVEREASSHTGLVFFHKRS